MFEFFIEGSSIKVYWLIPLSVILGAILVDQLLLTIRSIDAMKKFFLGQNDKKFLKRCLYYRHRFRMKKAIRLHDIFCGIIAAIHLSNHQEDEFIQNLNQIKQQTADTEKTIILLVLSYLTGEHFLTLNRQYNNKMLNELLHQTTIKSFLIEYHISLDQAKNNIAKMQSKTTNEIVGNILINVLEVLYD